MNRSSLENAVRDVYARLLDAWNRRDAADYAALFADDGALVGFDGSQVAGREVQDHLDPIFADHPTASYVGKVREIRPLGADFAMLRAIAGMIPPGGDELNSDANAVQTLIVEQQTDGWRVVLFQNTPAQHHLRPDLVEQHTAEIQQLATAGTLVA